MTPFSRELELYLVAHNRNVSHVGENILRGHKSSSRDLWCTLGAAKNFKTRAVLQQSQPIAPETGLLHETIFLFVVSKFAKTSAIFPNQFH